MWVIIGLRLFPNCQAPTSEKRVDRLTKRYKKYDIGFLQQLDATCIAIAAEEGRNGISNADQSMRSCF